MVISKHHTHWGKHQTWIETWFGLFWDVVKCSGHMLGRMVLLAGVSPTDLVRLIQIWLPIATSKHTVLPIDDKQTHTHMILYTYFSYTL